MEFVLKPHASSSASQYVASSQRSSPKLSPSYFPRFRVRPPCRRFRLAPSQRSSPQANSHGSISLLPNGALPTVFPMVSRPSTLSVLPSRSLPIGLSPSYFPRFPLRPPSRGFRIAPTKREPKHRRCFWDKSENIGFRLKTSGIDIQTMLNLYPTRT